MTLRSRITCDQLGCDWSADQAHHALPTHIEIVMRPTVALRNDPTIYQVKHACGPSHALGVVAVLLDDHPTGTVELRPLVSSR